MRRGEKKSAGRRQNRRCCCRLRSPFERCGVCGDGAGERIVALPLERGEHRQRLGHGAARLRHTLEKHKQDEEEEEEEVFFKKRGNDAGDRDR